jgi:dihydrofolate reductase
MGTVFFEITMSLDGFIAGPDVDIEEPMGKRGEVLHEWLFGDGTHAPTEGDRQVADEMFALTGAFVLGRRTFDVGEKPWGSDGAFGTPCFVVTHRARDVLVKGPTTFTFVTGGIESALRQAQAAAGDKDVCVMGGAAVARQFLAAGLLDELRIDLAPVLLGAGTRLFADSVATQIRLESTRLIESPFATHLRFRVVRDAARPTRDQQ